MSKLYTEEQVKELAYRMVIMFSLPKTKEEVDLLFKENLTPIELPTVKEIELKSVEYSTNTETKEFYKDCCWDFQNGAKWMRDKIKGGNNE